MKKSNFGFKQIEAGLKQKLVGDVFSSVAKKYDIMNDVMSMGLHRIWKNKFVDNIHPKNGDRFLDVAGGTGDIALRILRKINSRNIDAEITVSDINLEMLEEGKRNAIDKNLFSDKLIWANDDGQKLPYKKEEFDYYTIAYGIRNFADIQQGLNEAYRVLKKGGKFFCLEFTKVDNKLLAPIYDNYSFYIIPKLGKLLVGDEDSYKYFVESIRVFPSKDEFCAMMEKAGFKNAEFEDLTFGITTIFSAKK
jgi:demethylmenaquinone methyltransferase/2-methoxy-6-polyprenyl-1,4-benzoquinol methylase